MSIRSFCFEFDFGDAFVLFGSNHGLLWCLVCGGHASVRVQFEHGSTGVAKAQKPIFLPPDLSPGPSLLGLPFNPISCFSPEQPDGTSLHKCGNVWL